MTRPKLENTAHGRECSDVGSNSIMPKKSPSKQELTAEIAALRKRLAKVEKAGEAEAEKCRFLEEIFARSSQPFGIGYPDGRIGMVNPAFERLTGYTAGELGAMDWGRTLTPPEWHEMLQKKQEEMHRTRRPVRFEKEYLRKDGTRVPVELLVDLSLNAEGQAECYYTFVRDLTERKRSEEEAKRLHALIKQEKERLLALLNSISDEIWFVDTEGHYTLVNPSGAREFGLSGHRKTRARKLAKRPEVLRPDGSLRPDEEAPPIRALRGEWVRNHEEIMRMPAPGGLQYRLVNASPVKDAEGRTLGSVSIARDITGLKKVEQSLRESERRARREQAKTDAVLEAIPAHIAILDSDGVIVRVNKAWSAFAKSNGGDKRTCGVGVNYLAVCDATTETDRNQARQFASGIRSVIQGRKKGFSLEYPCHSPKRKRWFLAYVTAFRSAGSIHVVVANVDITAQKRIQDEIQKLNRKLETRVADRTSVLQTTVDQLEAENARRLHLEREILEISEREQYRFGQDLHDGLGQELAGLALISEVFSKRLQSESHPLARVAGELADCIRKTIDSARLLAKGLYPVELDRYGLMIALEDLAHRTVERYGISCKLKKTEPLPELKKPAEIHIYRIVQECIGNAIKHGAARRIIIEFRLRAGVHSFLVSDDGSGFKSSEKHSGMGMNIMNYRARMIGGVIRVEKPARGGCRISCRLPA